MPERVLVELDADAVDLVAEALRADSTRRQRAATRAAAELHEEREAGRRDIRSGAVMVTNLLVDAARLDDAATAVTHARPLVEFDLIPTVLTAPPAAPTTQEAPAAMTPPTPVAAEPPDDDEHVAGTRTPAEALAETRAVIADLGLNITREDIDAADDDLDGRLPEDDPGNLAGLPPELADLAPQEA